MSHKSGPSQSQVISGQKLPLHKTQDRVRKKAFRCWKKFSVFNEWVLLLCSQIYIWRWGRLGSFMSTYYFLVYLFSKIRFYLMGRSHIMSATEGGGRGGESAHF